MYKNRNLLTLVSLGLLGAISFISAFPQLPISTRAAEGLKFYYYPNPNEIREIIYNDAESLNNSNIKPATRTILLLDGFGSASTTPMYTLTTNNFAGREDVNMIVVDWGSFSGAEIVKETLMDVVIAYLVAFSNCTTAGQRLAEFVEFLRLNKQIEFSDITMISHSLGCHAAGAAGRSSKEMYGTQIGRIVGLDPSVQFTTSERANKLNQGDAEVVEIYHTNRNGAGDWSLASGDVTLYVNGGDNQPCEGTGICNSHGYSWHLYNFALNNDTIFGCPCFGATCLCNGCNFECSDPVRVGWHMPRDVRGSFHVSAGALF